MNMRTQPKISVGILFAVAILLGIGTATQAMIADGRERGLISAKVTVIVEKLPQEKKERMATFAEKVQNYINNRKWIQEGFVRPFDVGFQFFLEGDPSGIQDRYRCSLLATGPDIQYYDKRALFPFQEGEKIEGSATYVPVRGLIDFYMYMIIANELDKYGAFAGDDYFSKARGLMQEGKYSLYAYGWDIREDIVRELASENYRKYREMKDYFFYGLWSTDEPAQTRHYVMEALTRLEAVLKENRDNLAAKNFIDAHYQEIIDVFKDGKDATPFKIMIRIDPDRSATYQEYANAR